MKIIEIIFLALAIVSVSVQEKNSNNDKVASGSYRYSIEHSDNRNNNKYGHKIEVKDGYPKINIDLLKLKNSLTPTEKYQRSNALSTSAVQSLQPNNIPLMHFQKVITSPITTPSFAPPQPASAVHSQSAPPPATNMKFSSQQLALLLSQNKNPYLPLDKETKKQLSFTQSPAWKNLLATVPQEQAPAQNAPQIGNTAGYSPQVQSSNFVHSQQPTSDSQIYSNSQFQSFTNQHIPSPNIPSSVGQGGGASQFGAYSGYQSHYNQPQNTSPQPSPISHSPALPQSGSVPSSFPLSNNHLTSQPNPSSSPQIQYSFPASYGSSASHNSYLPQNVAGLTNSLPHSASALPSTPEQYLTPQYQTAGQHSGAVQFLQQNSQSPPTTPIKYEPANQPQNFVFTQNQAVPNIPKDFFVSSQAVNSPQIPSNYNGYQSTTSPEFAPQSANALASYGQSGAVSGLSTGSPYSSGTTYKQEIPSAPTQYSGQTNAHGAGLGSYASNAPAGFASIPSQGNVYGSNSIQGYTSGASSNQVYQTTPSAGYTDASKPYGTGVISVPAQYTVPHGLPAGAISGYPPASDNTHKSYRPVEYNAAPASDNDNVRYVYVMADGSSHGVPPNIK